jgi:hypothetical protein
VGGSRTAAGVPVFWEIRSDRSPNSAASVEQYAVGAAPPGFYETIPLTQPLPTDPTDLISIQSPPGDATSMNGMGFALADVPPTGIYRGNYETVSNAQFTQDGIASCAAADGASDPLLLLALAIFVTGIAFVAVTASRRIASVAVGVVTLALVLVRAPAVVTPQLVASPRQAAAAFAPGVAEAPTGRKILVDLSPQSPSVHAVSPTFYVARFLAPGDYAFVVSCSDTSIQIGESSEIPNGGTGSRQLVGCSTPQVVRSGIGSRSDRARLVEISVLTNGVSDWHVVVLDGGGDVGPFEQP